MYPDHNHTQLSPSNPPKSWLLNIFLLPSCPAPPTESQNAAPSHSAILPPLPCLQCSLRLWRGDVDADVG